MRLYHGTSPFLAFSIARDGLRAAADYVFLTPSEGVAWAFGAWAQGLVMAAGVTEPHPLSSLPGIGSEVARAVRSTGPNLAAVAVFDLPAGYTLEAVDVVAAPPLPWEEAPRAAPGYRTTGVVSARHLTEWRLFRVPELLDDDVLQAMRGDAHRLAAEYPRGELVLEDLTPAPIGPAIPNRRRLIAAVLDAMTGEDTSAHGLPHAARVAAHGIDLHPDADATVVLLFALLHDAARKSDGRDDGHGQRAAELARALNGTVFTLTAAQLDTLAQACALHTDGQVADDPTIGACWDADRLDLSRFAARIDPTLMSTDAGRARALEAYPSPAAAALQLPEVLDRYADELDA